MTIAVRQDYQTPYSNMGRALESGVRSVGQAASKGIMGVEKAKVDADEAELRTIRKKSATLTLEEQQRKFDQAATDKSAFNDVKSSLIDEIKENFKDMPAAKRDRTLEVINGIRFEGGRGIEKLQQGIINLDRLNALKTRADGEGVKMRGWDPIEIFMPDSHKRMQGDYEKMKKDAAVGQAVTKAETIINEKKPKTMEEAFSLLPQEVTEHDEVTNFIKKRFLSESKKRSLAAQETKARASAAKSGGSDKEFNNVQAARGGLAEVDKRIKETKESADISAERDSQVLKMARQAMLKDRTLNIYEAVDMAEKQVPPEEEPEEKPGILKRLFSGGETTNPHGELMSSGEQPKAGIQTVKSKEEWQKLAPGTKYMAPDGTVRIKK